MPGFICLIYPEQEKLSAAERHIVRQLREMLAALKGD